MLKIVAFLALVAIAAACKGHAELHDENPCPQFIGPPCPRFINNTMPDYPGGTVTLSPESRARMAVNLRNYLSQILLNMPPSFNDSADDGYSVYGGHAGRAIMFLRMWKLDQSGNRQALLEVAKAYLDAALTYLPAPATAWGFHDSEDGVKAIEAVLYDILGDKQRSQTAIAAVQARIDAIPDSGYGGDTFLPGISGVLYTGAYLNEHFKSEVITRASLLRVAELVIADGAKLGGGKYLAYTNTPWGSDITYGAGAGAGGVMRLLLSMPEVVQNPKYRTLLKNTLDQFVSIQYGSGNFPAMHAPNSDKMVGDDDDWVLVQWCHGAPGMVPALLLGYKEFQDQSYLNAATKAVDAIWAKGLLTKGMCLCHGISSNAYAFLWHARISGSQQGIYRAIKFAEWTLDPANLAKMRTVDSPFALYAGSINGISTVYADLIADPNGARQLAWDYEI